MAPFSVPGKRPCAPGEPNAEERAQEEDHPMKHPVLVLASRNRKKREEIQALLPSLAVRILTLDDFPEVPDPVEDGRTFAENARKKALFVASRTGHLALADDSGLEVDRLGGEPGVYSARYSGVEDRDTRDAANNRKLLERLRGVAAEHRTARFRCAIALASPDRILEESDGSVEGVILEESRGDYGFGYDPLFLYPPRSMTFAELPAEEKNRVSHRARALTAIQPALLRILGEESRS